ncbi:MAG: IS3 family transposase [Bacilli bacterium]
MFTLFILLSLNFQTYHRSKLHRKPFAAKQHKIEIKEKILEIHEESHQIYGVPKITQELHKEE